MKVIDNFIDLLREHDYDCRLENPSMDDDAKSEIHIFWFNDKKKEYGSVAINYIKKYQRAPESKLIEIIEKFTNKSIK
jgi:ASC-1-like (ASCH) protein